MKHHPALILLHYPPSFSSTNYSSKHKLRETMTNNKQYLLHLYCIVDSLHIINYRNVTDQLMGIQLKYALTPLSKSHGVRICAGTATSVQSRRYPNTAVATLLCTLASPPPTPLCVHFVPYLLFWCSVSFS